MRKQILILEDLELARKALYTIVKECDDELDVYTFSNRMEALDFAMTNHIDLFLIDIVLNPKEPNDFSGISFAQTIRANEDYLSSEIIFITTLAGLEAQLLRSIHCFDYIEKPIDKSRVQQVVLAALKKLSHQEKEDELLFVRKDGISFPIYTKDIVYLESRHKLLSIHKVDEVIEIRSLTLKKAMEKIKTQKLLVPSKGIAVNLRYIEYVDVTNRYIKLKHEKKLIDIGSRMKSAFLSEYYSYDGGRKK